MCDHVSREIMDFDVKGIMNSQYCVDIWKWNHAVCWILGWA